MGMSDLFSEYSAGNITRRVYWDLMREKILPIIEYQEFLTKNSKCDKIEISKEGIILHAEGVKLFFDFTQTICRAEAMLYGTEDEDFEFLASFVPENGTVFDIGANVGRFSLGIYNIRNKAEIYAFEPVKETFEAMVRNFMHNGIERHIKSYHMGFYDTKGELKFFVPAENEAASLRPVDDAYYMKTGNIGQKNIEEKLDEIICPVDTLDGFVIKNEINKIDFIKCDTEGAEKMVFKGGEYVFNKLQPILYTEMLRKHAKRFNYHPNDIINMLTKWNYHCFYVENKTLKILKEMTETVAETNFFFLHKVKHQDIIEKYSK